MLCPPVSHRSLVHAFTLMSAPCTGDWEPWCWGKWDGGGGEKGSGKRVEGRETFRKVPNVMYCHSFGNKHKHHESTNPDERWRQHEIHSCGG